MRGANVEGERRKLRQVLGYYLLLGLEFLIAADIIDTLMKPTTQDLIILGAIVAIRTVISYSLNSELAHEHASHRKGRDAMIAETLLIAAGIYLLCGLVFAIPFVLMGAGKIDPHAAHGSWGFRVLIIPGTMFLWPLLARRWLKGIHEPPEENNPHRCARIEKPRRL